MSKLLKASEARRIAEEEDEHAIVVAIMKKIHEAAENGEYEIQVREYGFGSIYGEPMGKYKKVVDRLRGLGYKARIEVISTQFVDIYLEISWKFGE